MPKNILQCIEQPPTGKNYPVPNVGSARVEEAWYTQTFSKSTNGLFWIWLCLPCRLQDKAYPNLQPPGKLKFIDSGKHCEVAIFVVWQQKIYTLKNLQIWASI